MPPSETAVTDHSSVTEVRNIRYVHLGPYPLQSLKRASKNAGVTLNSTLLSAIATAVCKYCRQSGDKDLQSLGVAVPVNFKIVDGGNMKANNDFATMHVSIPVEDGKSPDIDPSLWSFPNALGASHAQVALSLKET